MKFKPEEPNSLDRFQALMSESLGLNSFGKKGDTNVVLNNLWPYRQPTIRGRAGSHGIGRDSKKR